MAEIVIVALLTLNFTLSVATLVQVLTVTGKISKLCGQYETHLKGCADRFKTIEQRIERLDLQFDPIKTQEVENG